MKNNPAPIVTFDGLTDPTLPAVISIPTTRTQMLQSEWLDWLESHNRFKFESRLGKFTAYKSKKDYWTAQRRLHTKLRHEYLGTSTNLTYELLDQTAKKMNMGDSAYWTEKHSDPRVGKNTNVESHNENYETARELTLQSREKVLNLTPAIRYLTDDFDDYVICFSELKRLGYTIVDHSGLDNLVRIRKVPTRKG